MAKVHGKRYRVLLLLGPPHKSNHMHKSIFCVRGSLPRTRKASMISPWRIFKKCLQTQSSHICFQTNVLKHLMLQLISHLSLRHSKTIRKIREQVLTLSLLQIFDHIPTPTLPNTLYITINHKDLQHINTLFLQAKVNCKYL